MRLKILAEEKLKLDLRQVSDEILQRTSIFEECKIMRSYLRGFSQIDELKYFAEAASDHSPEKEMLVVLVHQPLFCEGEKIKHARLTELAYVLNLKNLKKESTFVAKYICYLLIELYHKLHNERIPLQHRNDCFYIPSKEFYSTAEQLRAYNNFCQECRKILCSITEQDLKNSLAKTQLPLSNRKTKKLRHPLGGTTKK